MTMDTCCLVCEGITGSSKERLLVDIDNGYKHHRWLDMIESMAKGCVLCKTVVEWLKPKYDIAMNSIQGPSDIPADTRVFVRAIWSIRGDQEEPEDVITPFGKRQLQKLEFHLKTQNLALHVGFDVEACSGMNRNERDRSEANFDVRRPCCSLRRSQDGI